MSEGEPTPPAPTPPAAPPPAPTPPAPTPPAPTPPATPPIVPTPAAPPVTWQSGLTSEDLRANPLLARFETVDDLANSHLAAQKFIGGEKIAVPQEGWAAEDYNTYWNALGRPEAASGYDLSGFTPPEGVEWSEEFQAGMVDKMHALGMTQAQVSGMFDAYGESVGGQYEAFQAQGVQTQTEGMATLKKEWGTSYGARVDQAKRAFAMIGGDKFQELAELKLEGGGRLGDNPLLIRKMADIGERLGEHSLMGPKTQRFSQSPDEAHQQEKTLFADKGFVEAYTNKLHPEHDAAVAKMRAVHAAQVGTAPVK